MKSLYLIPILLSVSALAACDPALPDGISESELTSDGSRFSKPRVYINEGPTGCSEPEYSCDDIVSLCPSGDASHFPEGASRPESPWVETFDRVDTPTKLGRTTWSSQVVTRKAPVAL